ncbi:hypothetical protein HMPREF9057_03179 [Actinomyces sp. oral taxon 171 str. F0337]|nr:hypothetical protein HMPREF9057_03179 [Actinomyces sp. oral taxon 171 str. F0337]
MTSGFHENLLMRTEKIEGYRSPIMTTFVEDLQRHPPHFKPSQRDLCERIPLSQ